MTSVDPLWNSTPYEVASNQSLHDIFSIVFYFYPFTKGGC